MKPLTCAAAIALCAIGSSAFAEPDPPAPTPHWNVRVEVLMVAIPQEKCLALLPDLRDPEKIETAIPKIFELIAKKKAILTGYPAVRTVDGRHGVSESIQEKRYPAQWYPPETATMTKSPNPRPTAPPVVIPEGTSPSAVPADFETNNVGTTLEVGAVVSNGEVGAMVSDAGEVIQFYFIAQRSGFAGFDYFDAGNTPTGRKLEVTQPRFQVSKDIGEIEVKNGEHRLVGVHALAKPADSIELFILQAIATPIP